MCNKLCKNLYNFVLYNNVVYNLLKNWCFVLVRFHEAFMLGDLQIISQKLP